MNIIKPGKTPDSISFTCSACGCEYEADKKDYMLTDVMLYKNKVITDVYSCDCPCCGWSSNRSV